MKVKAADVETKVSLIQKALTGQIRQGDLHIAQGVNRSLQGILSVKKFSVHMTPAGKFQGGKIGVGDRQPIEKNFYSVKRKFLCVENFDSQKFSCADFFCDRQARRKILVVYSGHGRISEEIHS